MPSDTFCIPPWSSWRKVLRKRSVGLTMIFGNIRLVKATSAAAPRWAVLTDEFNATNVDAFHLQLHFSPQGPEIIFQKLIDTQPMIY